MLFINSESFKPLFFKNFVLFTLLWECSSNAYWCAKCYPDFWGSVTFYFNLLSLFLDIVSIDLSSSSLIFFLFVQFEESYVKLLQEVSHFSYCIFKSVWLLFIFSNSLLKASSFLLYSSILLLSSLVIVVITTLNSFSDRLPISTSLVPLGFYLVSSVQFSSVAQSCPTLCDPMNHSTPGLPVHHQLPDFTQTHIHQVSDAIQPSHPLSSPSPPAPNPSQHQSLFQWINSWHEGAKVLEFQL